MSQSMFHQNKHVFKIHLRKVYLVFTTFIVCLNKFNYTFVYTLFYYDVSVDYLQHGILWIEKDVPIMSFFFLQGKLLQAGYALITFHQDTDLL